MRPRKKILLVDPDENRRSIWRYVLRIWGYKVRGVATSDAAQISVKRFVIDLTIVHTGRTDLPEEWLPTFLHRAGVVQPWMKTMLVAPQLRALPAEILVDCPLLGGACNGIDIRDRVKVLTKHKRGPRPALDKMLGQAIHGTKKPPARVALAEILAIGRTA